MSQEPMKQCKEEDVKAERLNRNQERQLIVDFSNPIVNIYTQAISSR